MKISESEDYWRLVGAHTSARNSSGAPWSVQLQVAALVGNHAITASFARFTPDAPSSWTIVAVTEDGRLVRVHMEFAAERYDLEKDRQRQSSVAPSVREAWVRRLADAVRLDIGRVQSRPDSFGQPSPNAVDMGEIKVWFNDGRDIDLDIDQATMFDSDDRDQADAFIDAVRFHANL
jgi:hypothetical protein